MEQTVEATNEVTRVPSIQTEVHHFQPSYSAQTGGNVVAPSFIGSSIGNININFTSISQGTGVSSTQNHDSADSDAVVHTQNKKIEECQQKLKASLKKKFSHLFEGMATDTNMVPLNKIYTELYITEGGHGAVNNEHEVRQIETTSRIHMAQEKSIHCNDLFIRDIRTVLTKGVAGIGKTVSTNKFSLDWAEERANTNLDFVFALSFRELNSMIKKTLSLAELLGVLFPEVRDTGIFGHVPTKMLIILDGLDESRLPLDFHKSEIISDVTQPTTIAVLLINLIRGRLLPSAHVWITSRPVASCQIPLEYINLITEVRGFNNLQKDEYFRRKISDESLTNRVIAHVKSCRSLHIMCHIPVFCWMAATVLEKKLAQNDSKDTPKTLTQMYIHFLSLYVENMKKRLPGRRQSNTDSVRSNLMCLGKLAFEELKKGHLIFYERDLILNGINVTQASMFSGIYTQIFNEEVMLCEEKMFCFVHLSVQEFFAALYVFLMFHNDNINVLVKKSSARWFLSRGSSELIFYKEAVEKTLSCDNGHFDIFLRFLLGLSLESNQSLLKNLMTSCRTHQNTRAEIIKHIKEKIRVSSSTDRCLNLFHCLNELNDHSLVDEIQSYLSSGSVNQTKLSPAQWATLVFVLLTSEEELSVFELRKYSRSEEGLLRLLPVVRTARVAKLNSCNLTVTCCETLANSIITSQITELDLSNNNLTDAGLQQLSDGLKSSKLEKLRLASCNLTEQSCDHLASLISSGVCQLKVLDLSDNDFEDVGVRQLSVGLGSPHCKLETLSLSLCRVTEEGCTFLASAMNTSCLKELDLSYNHPGTTGLTLLTALLEDPGCSLENLSVEQCDESRIQPAPKKYVSRLTLDPNTAHRDLTLSEGNQRARRWTKQPCPDHPDRFDFWTQVLCTQEQTSRCYWETEWSGRVVIGVAYRSMCRKGDGHDSWLGRNDSSWALSCTKASYRVLHEGINTTVSTAPSSSRVGVYLDWSAGTLSFYSISGKALSLLHTFHTTFTKPVYAGFHLGWVDSTICLC